MNNEELDKLLPWYANNTLGEDEKRAVEAYLKESESARQELALIKNMAEQIKQEPQSEVSELAWRRLKKQIQAEQVKPSPSADKAKAAMPSWAASLGVAAMLVIALQLTFVFQPTQENAIDAELLSSMPETITEPHWLLQLAFEPTATWSDITATLEHVNGVIIDGPSSIGLIRAAIPRENARFEESQALLGWLKTQPAVVHVALEDK